ncbi:MAG: hypothetical protein FVQ83_12850 [Chloroflexi bacterium]|nr:hypothetical protein [Chloroflexota bacterium]
MSPTRSPSPIVYLPTSVLFFILGWGGLITLMNTTSPTLGPRWLFFFLIVVALTGTALPASAYLNHRFPSNPPAEPSVILRQALWVGIYAATITWLNYGDVLNGTLALILLLGLAIIEGLLRLREHSRWKPRRDKDG